MVPLAYYEEIYDFCNSLDCKFIYSLQTNGTLLNSEILDFFKKNNTSIGLSFDGLGNDVTRSHTNILLDNIKLLQEYGFDPGAVMVVNQSNVNNLIEEYKYFNMLNLGMKINPMFNDGAAKSGGFLDLNPDDYVKNFIALFKYWTTDENCNISVSTCEELVNLVLNEYSRVCTFNSCLGNWLCLDSNGYLYPCDRLCVEKYNLGNVVDMNTIEEAFQNYNFLNLLKKSIERRNECIEKCSYYNNCYAGCNANAILGELNGNNVSCYIQKSILEEIKDYIIQSKNNLSNLNDNYKRLLLRK